MAEPMQTLQEVVPVKLSIENVRFEGGKLWKPRYDSLIDYSYAPAGFQFEPAFMLRSAAEGEEAEVEVVFQIDPAEKVVFEVLPDGSVNWDLLFNPPQGSAPVSVEVEVFDPEHRACRVRWQRTGARCAAVRIRCRPLIERPEHPWSAVEGGVYLVILDPGDSLAELEPAQKDAGQPVAQTVRLLGVDEHHRPVYDLFRGQVPPELIAEPAFRAAHGERLDFQVALDLPELYQDARFEVDAEGQAKMFYAIPTVQPPDLVSASVHQEGKECAIQWHRPVLGECKTGQQEAATGPCLQWNIANFYAELASAGEGLRVDPTVIEPPACDASGICGPPRQRCEDEDDDSACGREAAKIGVVAQRGEPGETEPGGGIEPKVHGTPGVDQR